MNRQTRKRIKRIVSVVLIAAMMTSIMFTSRYSTMLVNAATNNSYVSEVKLAYGSDSDEVKNRLISAGFQVYEKDLNEETGETFVYMGYKTTSDPTEALTDIKAVEQDNGYQLYDATTILEGMKGDALNDAMNLMKLVLAFRQAYESGVARALDAYDFLQNYRYDDNGKMLGDFIIYEADEMNLTDVVLYSEAVTYQGLVEAMAIGAYCDETNTWLVKLSQKPPVYEENSVLKANARKLLKAIQSFKLKINNDDEEELKDSACEVITTIVTLSKYNYKGAPVCEYLFQENLTAEMLYEISAIMTDVDFEVLTELGLSGLCNVSDNIVIDDESSAVEDTVNVNISSEEFDFWAGSAKTDNRTIALTNDVVRDLSSGNENHGIESVKASSFCGSIGTGVTAAISTATTAYLWYRYIKSMQAVEVVTYWERFFPELATGAEASKECWSLAIKTEQMALRGQAGQLKFVQKTIYDEWNATIKDFYIKGKMTKSLNGSSDFAKLKSTARARMGFKGAAIASSVVSLLMVALVGLMVTAEIKSYYNPSYSVRPDRILSLEIRDDGDSGYVVYKGVYELGSDEDIADTNAYKGLKWNALYGSKDDLMGTPIKADTFTASKGSALAAVTYFGQVTPADMNNNARNHNKTVNIYFEKANEGTMASLFTSGNIAIIAVVLAIALTGGGVVFYTRKKKKGKGKI